MDLNGVADADIGEKQEDIISCRRTRSMHYVTCDIHNDNEKFNALLKKMDLSEHDHLIILGDLFDRSSSAPDPVGGYFNVLKLEKRCTVIRGNHDQWLAKYIINYYRTPERKRARMEPYPYNTFELLLQRLTFVDMQNLANWILSWPAQVELELGNEKYLLAHAMTSIPAGQKNEDYYLAGEKMDEEFLQRGIDGYISVCGHTNLGGNYIWKNTLKMYMYVIVVVAIQVAGWVACVWKLRKNSMCEVADEISTGVMLNYAKWCVIIWISK